MSAAPTPASTPSRLVPLGALLLAGMMFYGARASVGNFVEAWQAAFDATRGQVSTVATAMFLTMAVSQGLAGWLAERVPAWRLLFAGMALGAAGLTLAAVAPTLRLTVLGAGLLMGAGAGLAANSTLSVIATQLFRERHGTLFGIIGASTAAGTILLLPLSRAALEVSLELGLLVLAGGVAIGALGVLLFLRGSARRQRSETPVPVRRIVAQRDFWLLGIPFFICGVTSTGVTDPHLMPYMEGCGLAPGTASAIASALAAFNVVGTLGAGLLTDRVDQRVLLASIYATRGLSLLVLPLLAQPALLAVFAVAYGLADFSTVPPTNALARVSFRTGGWATFLGLIGAAHQVGSALGARLGGLLYDETGGYGLFFVVAAALCGVAAVLALGAGRATRAPAGVAVAAA